MARFRHAANRHAGHHFANPDGRGVRLRRAHAPAHVRVHRKIKRANQELGILQRWNRRLDELEVGLLGESYGPSGEQNLAVDYGHAVHLSEFGPAGVRNSRVRLRRGPGARNEGYKIIRSGAISKR